MGLANFLGISNNTGINYKNFTILIYYLESGWMDKNYIYIYIYIKILLEF